MQGDELVKHSGQFAEGLGAPQRRGFFCCGRHAHILAVLRKSSFIRPLNGDDDRPLFAFPGIWQHWTGPFKKDGAPVEADLYAFLTTEPNDLTRAINHERMPVLLSSQDQFETWLSGSTAEAFALARSFDPAQMRVVLSGKTKEDLLDA